VKKSSENILKKCLFFAAIAIVVALVIFTMVKYGEEGEKEMPFYISKILLISTVDGEKVDDDKNIWNINVTQVNDAYIYIEESEKNVGSKVTIQSVSLENFVINEAPSRGNIKILRPTGDMPTLYKNSSDNYLDSSILYMGDRVDDMKAGDIGNKGGTIGFRCAVADLGNFISNDTEEVIYDGRLLNNLGVTESEVKTNISFDIVIETSQHVKFKGTLSLEMPVEGVLENGSSNVEITDFSDVVFKRI
jgi:hypothetical protein